MGCKKMLWQCCVFCAHFITVIESPNICKAFKWNYFASLRSRRSVISSGKLMVPFPSPSFILKEWVSKKWRWMPPLQREFFDAPSKNAQVVEWFIDGEGGRKDLWAVFSFRSWSSMVRLWATTISDAVNFSWNIALFHAIQIPQFTSSGRDFCGFCGVTFS